MRAPLSHRGAFLGALGGIADGAALGMSPLTAGPPAKERPLVLVRPCELHPLVQFSRSTTGAYLGADGLLHTAAINEPRFEFDYLGNYQGMLFEPSATNVLLRSEQFDNATWTKSGCSISADATTAPDGNVTADQLIEDSSTGAHQLIQSGGAVVSGTNYVFSVFVKPASGTRRVQLFGASGIFNKTATFDLVAKTAAKGGWDNASIVQYPNGWLRCWCAGPAIASATGNLFISLDNGSTNSYTGDGASGVYVWGAQFESIGSPSSYIPTTSAQVTRGSDVNHIDFGPMRYSPQAMTIYVEGDYGNGDSTIGASGRIFFSASNASLSDAVLLYNDANAITGVSFINSGRQTTRTVAGTIPANTTFKAAFAAAQDRFIVAKNGQLSSPGLSGLLPQTISMAQVGGWSAAGNSSLRGHIKELRYYRRRLSDAALVALTS